MIREKQNQFIENFKLFDNWTDKFNYLIELGEDLPAECPRTLLPYRFEFCQSKTCFFVDNDNGKIKLRGWSNSAVMAGIIVVFKNIFDGEDTAELNNTDIDFHIKTGLIESLTILRRQSLEKMIDEIVLLSKSILN
ncbi:MAG: SufE family protein [Prevotellaceae bacterium]|jgi:cysteine desulfuration protein SufE|nr:SufE family protein [Prevotellaceae bacterium]